MRFLAALLLVAASTSVSRADLVITGLMDGTIGSSSTEPQALEFYVEGTIDFSTTTLTIESSPYNTVAFGSPMALSSLLGSLGSVTNSFVYLVGDGDSLEFADIFGTAGDFGNKAEMIIPFANGNPAYRIMDGSTVVDQIGFATVLPYYRDGWVYRKDGTGPDGGFDQSNFTFSGNDALDGMSAAQIEAAVPFGTFTLASIPEPSSFLFGGLVAAFLGVSAGRRKRTTTALKQSLA